MFHELVNDRRFEINKLSEEIDFNNLNYYYADKSAPNYIARFKGSLIIYHDIKNGRVRLQKKEKFRLELNERLNGNPNNKSENQISVIKNIKNLYNGRGKVL